MNWFEKCSTSVLMILRPVSCTKSGGDQATSSGVALKYVQDRQLSLITIWKCNIRSLLDGLLVRKHVQRYHGDKLTPTDLTSANSFRSSKASVKAGSGATRTSL